MKRDNIGLRSLQLLKQKHWLAVIRENHWVVARVTRQNTTLDILKFLEFNPEPEQNTVRDYPAENENLALQKEGTFHEKQLDDFDTMISLKDWLRKNHVPIKRLRIAVSCPGAITRIIIVPLMSARDLNQLLTEHVDQYFTLNISDYVVDYRVLDRIEVEGESRQRILLAALPKHQWKMLWSKWESFGFKPKVVDLAADGLARLYSKLAAIKKKEIISAKEQLPDMAIVDLSGDRVEFILLEQGVFFLYSDLQVTFKSLDQVIIALNGIFPEHKDGSNNKTNELDYQTLELFEWAKGEIETALGNVLQTLAEFLGFFAAKHFGKTVDHVFLTGDYANIPFLQEIFENNLEVSTRVGFPNGWCPRFKEKINILPQNALKYGSLYGLAFREG
ncbi:pilus assembly protein PilM [Desulfosporosinus sp. FKB]|uniref:pilus assembly protein PilM n=1 Tax=Desulfosporosinus sp. FKB TaxID=1969835 RepID=UPI000B4A2AFF|nr:pilus assembly protein PilM [Desulfosporosinus sp. FKB]